MQIKEASFVVVFMVVPGRQLETEDPARALEYFYEGLGHIIPEDTPVDRMSSTPAIGPDLCRDVFKFLLSIRASAPQNIHSTRYTHPPTHYRCLSYYFLYSLACVATHILGIFP